jgi:hypothetical protein
MNGDIVPCEKHYWWGIIWGHGINCCRVASTFKDNRNQLQSHVLVAEGSSKEKLTAGTRVKKIKPLTSGPEEKKTRRHVQMKVV